MKKVLEEIKTISRTALFFAIVFLLMMVMKKLELQDYDIEFTGISQALIGALILSKVVILMDMIKPGRWRESQPVIVDVIFRTFFYTAGVAVVVILEKAFEKRHEAKGFGDAISYVFSHRDIYHVWATTIGTSVALFIYHVFAIFKKIFGERGLAKLFFRTSLKQVDQLSINLEPKNNALLTHSAV